MYFLALTITIIGFYLNNLQVLALGFIIILMNLGVNYRGR